ncbi:MAG TPA: two-component regulator propeller domain-containing protein, partial [Flavobacteriales bacterium]|nr:two-component regulator propeller domain-containing protein [Flavobacteriales bacterium]
CEALQTLVVYYGNGNLDLVQGNTSFNMGDIARSSILGDKAIYGIHLEGSMAYLACGFGIVVADLERREVRETWFIGENGGQEVINAITFSADSIYAAGKRGLFTASRTSNNLAYFGNWHKRTDMGPAMADGPFELAVTFSGRPIIGYHDSANNKDTVLVLMPDNTWQRFGPTLDKRTKWLSVTPDGNYLVTTHENDIQSFDTGFNSSVHVFGYASLYPTPARSIRTNAGIFWVADRSQGLAQTNGDGFGSIVKPNGPLNSSGYKMDSRGGVVYVATGAVSGNWGNQFLKDGVNHFVNEDWRTTNNSNNTLFATGNNFGGAINDVVAVAVDPTDPNHAYAGSWDDGLIEFRNRDAIAVYNETNSSLGVVTNDGSGKTNVAGLSFDANNNLWMTNAWSDRPLSVLTTSGTWKSFTPGSLLNGNLLLAEVVAAQNGLKWIIRPRGNALLVFNDGGTITDESDDQWKLLNNTVGTGGLPAPDVLAIAEDKEGQMWVGTSKGIAVFYTPDAIFSGEGNYDAQQILIEQDGNVQVLLETEFVSCIAVDGANRKWIGTQTGGAFLVSADGRTLIHHFAQENSPLP